MTQTTAGDQRCRLDWHPGAGGLLALVPPEWAPHVPAPADPNAVAIAADALHITLLRRASMLPLVEPLGPEWATLANRLPRPTRPRFVPQLHRATRPPHPDKDPPGETERRTTWFLAVDDQEVWRKVLAEIVHALDAEARRRGGPGFASPEPRRFFHLSLFNDRGGDPSRSIGDIGPAD